MQDDHLSLFVHIDYELNVINMNDIVLFQLEEGSRFYQVFRLDSVMSVVSSNLNIKVLIVQLLIKISFLEIIHLIRFSYFSISSRTRRLSIKH